MKKAVLVIEDEPDVANIVRLNLRRAGFSVRIANTGPSGLSHARNDLPDIIILDLMLPEMNGLEVCKQLKTGAQTGRIPIVMLTAKTEEADRLSGFRLGADDYVTKPFSPKELVYRVQALVRRSNAGDAVDILDIDGFVVDRLRLKIAVDGDQLDLTSTEFRMLNFLLERCGRPQAREVLLSEVLGYSGSVDTRTVDTHIRRLRQKLGKHANRVETVRGDGYRFRAVLANGSKISNEGKGP